MSRATEREAVRLLLDGEPEGSPKWKALLDRAQVSVGLRCAYCNSERVESASCGFGTTSYRCDDCDEQWELTREGEVRS